MAGPTSLRGREEERRTRPGSVKDHLTYMNLTDGLAARFAAQKNAGPLFGGGPGKVSGTARAALGAHRERRTRAGSI